MTGCCPEQSSSNRRWTTEFPNSVSLESTCRSKTTLANSALKNREEEEEEDDLSACIVPEVGPNRMMKRMGLSIGIPQSIGLLFFPLFYYLKVGLKIDVLTWVPLIVSFFFGSAVLGVTYGIVSSSWDPLREGSLLGWNEAQKNWPVVWKSIWGGGSSKNK